MDNELSVFILALATFGGIYGLFIDVEGDLLNRVVSRTGNAIFHSMFTVGATMLSPLWVPALIADTISRRF